MPPVKYEVPRALATAITGSGIRVEHVEEFPLNSIKAALQVRADQTADDAHLNQTKVREYKIKFLSGTSVCPPIGVTRDGVLVWGNHRVGAAREAGREDLPAMIFDVDGADPDEHLRHTLMSFGGRENSGHGLAYSARDRELMARTEIVLGTTDAVIQSTYGISQSSLSGLKREMKVEVRLSELGITKRAEHFDRSTKRAFAGPNARALTNQPFADLVKLAAQADLKSTEINALAAAAKMAGTEDGAVQVIADKRVELAKQIAEVERSGHRTPPTPLTRLKKAVGEVSGLCEKNEPSTYRDYTGEIEETKRAIRSAIECLQNILAVQEA